MFGSDKGNSAIGITLVGGEAHNGCLPVAKAVRNRFGVGVLLDLLSYNTSESNREIHADSSLAKMVPGPLSPLPQLLPRLDEYLHFSRAGKSVVDQAAVLEAAFVEFPHAARAQMREVVTKLFKLFFVQNIRFFVIGSPGHNERS
jgi:hypothetical protein